MGRWVALLFAILFFLLSIPPSSTTTAQENTSPLPDLESITANNANQLQFLGYLGRGGIDDAIWSPDGQYVAIVNQQGVYLYDSENFGAAPQIFVNPMGRLGKVAFSPDGTMLAFSSGRYDGATGMFVRLWDKATGEERAALRIETGVYPDFAFSPDSAELAMTGVNAVRILDAATGNERGVLPHSEFVSRLAFSPDGRWLVSVGQDGIARVWNTQSDDEVATLSNSPALIPGLLFSPDGSTLAVSSNTNVRLWDVNSWTERSVIQVEEAVEHIMTFSPDSDVIAVGSSAGYFEDNAHRVIRVYDVQTGLVQATLPGNGPLTFGPQGLAFLIDRALMIWNEHGEIRRVPIPQPVENYWFNPSMTRVATVGRLHPDPNTLDLFIWNAETGVQEQRMSFARQGGWHSITFNSDGTMFAVGGASSLQLWRIDVSWPGPPVYDWPSIEPIGVSGVVGDVRFSPNDEFVVNNVCGGVSFAGGWELWNLRGGRLAFVGDWYNYAEPQCPSTFAFSPDSKVLATGHIGGMIRWWDIANVIRLGNLSLNQGAEIRSWQAHSSTVANLVYTPDGKTLISFGGADSLGNSDYMIRFWNSESGDLVKEYQAPDVTSVALSPDGRFLAASSNSASASIGIYDLTTDELTFTIPNAITGGLIFSLDGSLIVVVSGFGFAAYDVATGQELVNEWAYNGALGGLDIAFHPTDHYLLSAAADGTIRMWGVPSADD
jgi:WD40 repeat protein